MAKMTVGGQERGDRRKLRFEMEKIAVDGWVIRPYRNVLRLHNNGFSIPLSQNGFVYRTYVRKI